jgi:subtilisin-like proprotein convertase family protein
MHSHASLSFLVLLCLALPLFADVGPEAWRPDPTVFDSTDRRSYVYSGPPVFFGPNTGFANMAVTDQIIINDVDVLLSITHTWDSDVRLILIAPNATEVVLISNVGDDGDNFSETYLNDDAETPLMSGSPPFTGSFQPSEPLSELNGMTGTGTWRLRLEDVYPSADDGVLTEWTLILGGLVGGIVQGVTTSYATGLPMQGVSVQTVQPGHSTLSDSLGHYRLFLPPGRFDLLTTLTGWCIQQIDDLIVVQEDTFDINFLMHQPLCQISNTSLNVEIAFGRTDSSFLILQNDGNCSLTYRTTTDAMWLSAVPDSGAVDPWTVDTIWVNYSAENLAEGEYLAHLVITHNALRSPLTIPVFLWVAPPNSAQEISQNLPTSFDLASVYPNPFNIETTILYNLPRQEHVTLDLYNVNGQLAERLIDKITEPGYHRLTYNASQLSSGTYFLRMTAQDFVNTRKIVLVK